MSLARQLHDLQEIDLALKSNEQAQVRISSQLGESREIARVRARLADVQDRLKELIHQQHSLEWEVDDLSVKVSATEEKLFSGRIRNPKELANLQSELNTLSQAEPLFPEVFYPASTLRSPCRRCHPGKASRYSRQTPFLLASLSALIVRQERNVCLKPIFKAFLNESKTLKMQLPYPSRFRI